MADLLKKRQDVALEELADVRDSVCKLWLEHKGTELETPFAIWYKSLVDAVHIIDPGFDELPSTASEGLLKPRG
jgi:hypothetical protein